MGKKYVALVLGILHCFATRRRLAKAITYLCTYSSSTQGWKVSIQAWFVLHTQKYGTCVISKSYYYGCEFDCHKSLARLALFRAGWIPHSPQTFALSFAETEVCHNMTSSSSSYYYYYLLTTIVSAGCCYWCWWWSFRNDNDDYPPAFFCPQKEAAKQKSGDHPRFLSQGSADIEETCSTLNPNY